MPKATPRTNRRRRRCQRTGAVEWWTVALLAGVLLALYLLPESDE